jgi:ABC-type multidrug transport system ATPase subunit/ABC-type multidrug transport system permease subunit
MQPIQREASVPVSLNVGFTDLTLTLNTKDGKGKISRRLLDNLHGSFAAGKLTAIIGPSGCGKSTLLNVLSGRMGPSSVPHSVLEGDVSLNGELIDPVNYKQRFAYVMSEDALYSTTTPREAFNFVASLRLENISPEARQARCEQMLESLGLESCADTLIGNSLLKGVSSGERKRTSVGVELLPDPEVVFLDEPTTGLDSFTALELIRVVRKIADMGKTVLCVIHQPSSEIYELFDDVVYMKSGKILYQGQLADATEYFASHGFRCPTDYNPADYIMYVLQTISASDLERLDSAWRIRAEDIKSSVMACRSSSTPLKLKPLPRASLYSQVMGLFGRELKRTIRDPSAFAIRVAITLFLSVLVGCLFYNVGEDTNGTISVSHIGGVTNMAIFAMFASGQALLITFPYERPVVLREYSNGLYSIATYVASKITVEFPIIVLNIFILGTIVYFLEGLVGNYIEIILAMCMLAFATAGTALLFGASIRDVDKVVELGFLLFVPQILFSGFFVAIDQIPGVLRWAQWLCSIKYAINMVYIAEFTGLNGADELFTQNDVNDSFYWVYAAILLGFTLVTIALATLMLRYQSKSVY